MSVIDAIIAKKLCGGGGGSVPKPLTYDYMPEGYPTRSVQTTTLMEEQELEFVSGVDAYSTQLTNPLEIVEGQTYTVKWDGTEYKCICSIFNDAILTLGNLSITGAGDDTGEPFIYGYNKNLPSGQFLTFDTSASHTISIKRIDEIVIPMAEEFLPNIPAEKLPAGGGGSSDSGKLIVVVYNKNQSGTILGADKTYNEIRAAIESGISVVVHRKKNINNADYQVFYLTENRDWGLTFCSYKPPITGEEQADVLATFIDIYEENGEMGIEARRFQLQIVT